MSVSSGNDYWKNRKADSFDQSAYSSGRVAAIQRLVEMAAERLRRPAIRSMELGCGSGLFAEISGVRNITGVDYSETLLEVARRRMDEVRLESIFELKERKESLDNIVSLFVIDDYSTDTKEKFFADIFSFLKKNGHLFFAAYTPDDEGMQKFFQLSGYETYVEPASVYKEILTCLGFSIEVFDIINAQGEMKLDGVIQPIEREYVLIDAVKK